MKIDNKVLLTQALEFALGKLPDQAGIKLTLEEYDESMAERRRVQRKIFRRCGKCRFGMSFLIEWQRKNIMCFLFGRCLRFRHWYGFQNFQMRVLMM